MFRENALSSSNTACVFEDAIKVMTERLKNYIYVICQKENHYVEALIHASQEAKEAT